MAGPIYAVQPGMGEQILIQVFVVIVIGGIGSIRGALVGALIVGMVDTLGRAFLKPMLAHRASRRTAADTAGPALASMLDLPADGGRARRPARGAVPRAARLMTNRARASAVARVVPARCWRGAAARRPRSTSRSTSTCSGAS